MGRLDKVIFFSMVGRVLLAIAALVSMAAAGGDTETKAILVFELLRWPLWGQIMWASVVLLIYRGWLYLGAHLPSHADLCVLFVVDSVLTCATSGLAFAAISALGVVIKRNVCTTATICSLLGVSGALAGAAGALNAVSALGIFWTFGSRFRQAQD